MAWFLWQGRHDRGKKIGPNASVLMFRTSVPLEIWNQTISVNCEHLGKQSFNYHPNPKFQPLL